MAGDPTQTLAGAIQPATGGVVARIDEARINIPPIDPDRRRAGQGIPDCPESGKSASAQGSAPSLMGRRGPPGS